MQCKRERFKKKHMLNWKCWLLTFCRKRNHLLFYSAQENRAHIFCCLAASARISDDLFCRTLRLIFRQVMNKIAHRSKFAMVQCNRWKLRTCYLTCIKFPFKEYFFPFLPFFCYVYYANVGCSHPLCSNNLDHFAQSGETQQFLLSN